MDWTETLRSAIEYMEAHLLEKITAEDVAAHVFISPFYLQRGFEIVTGCTVSRYLRSRRLYLAALDLAAGRGGLIDISAHYGFETPESFTKAFSRFHGATPTQVRENSKLIKPFFPMKITISVQGGNAMEYTIMHKPGFQVIGFQREIPFDAGHRECPRFWEEISKQYLEPLQAGKEPESPWEQAVLCHHIGEYGVCLDDGGGETFRYMIGGLYRGGPVPEGMVLHAFPETDWAVFPCRGPLPGAFQALNSAIFREWLPGNPKYELALEANIEWYSPMEDSPDYESAIWVPVKQK